MTAHDGVRVVEIEGMRGRTVDQSCIENGLARSATTNQGRGTVAVVSELRKQDVREWLASTGQSDAEPVEDAVVSDLPDLDGKVLVAEAGGVLGESLGWAGFQNEWRRIAEDCQEMLIVAPGTPVPDEVGPACRAREVALRLCSHSQQSGPSRGERDVRRELGVPSGMFGDRRAG